MMSMQVYTPSMVQSIHVLLVEDSTSDAFLFKHRLSLNLASSYTCDHVEDLSEALAYLQGEEAVEIVVLDLNLPDAVGLEGLKALSAAAPHLPMVIMSGVDDRELTDRALRAGAQDYLTKGEYTPLLLDRTLRYAIERNRNKQHLRRSGERLRTIVEHVSDGIVLLSQEHDVLFVNPAAEQMLGCEASDLVGKQLPFAVQTLVSDVEEVVVREHAAPVVLEVQQVPSVWEQQEALLLTLRDVTGRKALEEHLRTAKDEAEAVARFKTSLLRNVNHDLRTPLSAILGFAEELEQDDLTDEMRREFAGIIREGSEQLLATIESVLAYAELDAAVATPACEEVAIDAVAAPLVALLQPLAAEKSLTLTLHNEAEETHLTTDAVYVKRILENLIGNAIKFTEAGGITVTLRSTANIVSVAIADTGVGISDVFLPHIFEEFRKDLSGLHTHAQGSGLGLAITRKLTEALGGRLEVASQEGVGTTFTLTLPRDQAVHEAQQ